jgi:hypothetical protein
MGIFSKIKRGIIGAIKGIINIVMKVVSLISMPFGTLGDTPGQNQQESFINEVKVNKESGVSNVPIIYGRRRVGGTRVFVGIDAGGYQGEQNTTGGTYLRTVTVLGFGTQVNDDDVYSGQIGAINGWYKIFIDEKEVPMVRVPDYYWNTATAALPAGRIAGSYASSTLRPPYNIDSVRYMYKPVSTSPYAGRLVVELYHNGVGNQGGLMTFPSNPQWTNNHKCMGFAALVCQFKWLTITTQAQAEANPYGRGVPVVEVEVQGKPIKDLLSASAYPGNLGLAGQSNPVHVLYDYMTTYCGIAPSEIDYTQNDSATSFYKAAYQCNQSVPTYLANGTVGTRKAFTFNGIIDTGKTLMDNVKMILESFRGLLTYRNGKYYLQIDNAGNDSDITNIPTNMATYSVMTLDQDVLIEGLKISGDNIENKFNKVRVTYCDPDANYNATDVYYPEKIPSSYALNQQYLTEDQLKVLEKTITLANCTNRDEAYHYGQVILRRSRNQLAIEAKCTMAAANLAVGDIVRVNNPAVAIDKYCRVMSVKLTPEATIELGLIEHVAEAYTFNPVTPEPDRPAFISIDPFKLDPPTSVSIAFKYSAIIFNGVSPYRDHRISWTKSASPGVAFYRIFKASEGQQYGDQVGVTQNTFFEINSYADNYNVKYYVDAVNSTQTVKSTGILVSATITTEYEPSTGSSTVINAGTATQSVGSTQFGA